jgi:hypothetical protein
MAKLREIQEWFRKSEGSRACLLQLQHLLEGTKLLMEITWPVKARDARWPTLVQQGELPAFKLGGDYRYRRSEIVQWLERYRVNQ